MIEALQYEFMRNALFAAVLASIACGVIGSYVVIKRLVFISGGISHSAFGGIGLAYFLGIDPLITLIPFSILCALGIGWLSQKTKVASDTAIGIFWALGMAIGIILINLSPGYSPDLFSYLFGSILTVPNSDLFLMLILNFMIVISVFLLYREFQAISFDEEYAEVSGLPVKFLYLLLLCLIALTIVILIRIVGIILVIALLTIPSATAKFFSKSLKGMMLLSIFFGMFFTLTGLGLSYIFNLASGATIILIACVFFLIASLAVGSSRA